MGYFYTDHFLQRLRERRISLEEVHGALQFPDRHYIGSEGEDVFERGKLRVILKKRNNHFIFLTAYTL